MKIGESNPAHPGREFGGGPLPKGPHRWIYVWLLVPVALVGLGFFVGMPWYRHAKTQRAQRIAREVMAQLDSGSGTNGLPLVRLMLGLAPDDEIVLRAAARFCTRNVHPDALVYWQRFFAVAEGTRDDHLGYALAAVDRGRYEIAVQELVQLIVRPGGDVEAARVALRLAMKRGAWEFASRVATHVLELDPGDEQAELWRSMALVRTGHPDLIVEAKAHLIAQMLRVGDRWRDAADVLLDAPGLNGTELRILRQRIRTPVSEAVPDRLRELSVDWLLDPDLHARSVETAVKLLGSATSGDDIQRAGRWLLVHGAAEPLLKAVPLESSRGDRVKMQLHVMALARLGRWDQVSTVADLPDSGLEPHVAEVMAIAAASLKPNGRTQSRARAVLADRNLLVPDLLEAAQLAEENGLREAAILLLEPLLENDATMPEAANRILALSGGVDSMVLRRRALDRLVNAFPKDMLALQMLGYVEAVVPGGDLEVVDRLERQPTSATNQFARMAFALREVRRGKPDAALAHLAAAVPADPGEDSRVHMAYAVAYGSMGDYHEARRHADLAQMGHLQVEERDLIGRWLPANSKLPPASNRVEKP
jgi:tetratricopeptide (TPR) repeat protein